MIYPSADELENWGSKYSLVVLVAKRAKQIKSGAPPLVETSSRNPLTIALEEVAAGKIHCQVADHDILPKTTQEAEVAQLLAIPTVALDDEAAREETETTAIFSDEADVLSEEEEAEEEEEEEEEIEHEEEEEGAVHAPDLDEEVEEEEEEEEPPLEVPELGFEAEDVDEEAEPEVVIEPEAVVEAAPKPKRGRKKKEPEVVTVDEPEAASEAETEE
jgi:DNA-directed RNA polymerase omega subunit